MGRYPFPRAIASPLSTRYPVPLSAVVQVVHYIMQAPGTLSLPQLPIPAAHISVSAVSRTTRVGIPNCKHVATSSPTMSPYPMVMWFDICDAMH
jgi:hypothetical protein